MPLTALSNLVGVLCGFFSFLLLLRQDTTSRRERCANTSKFVFPFLAQTFLSFVGRGRFFREEKSGIFRGTTNYHCDQPVNFTSVFVRRTFPFCPAKHANFLDTIKIRRTPPNPRDSRTSMVPRKTFDGPPNNEIQRPQTSSEIDFTEHRGTVVAFKFPHSISAPSQHGSDTTFDCDKPRNVARFWTAFECHGRNAVKIIQ